MMKKLLSALALALALILALGNVSLAETAQEDPVAFTIDGEEVRVSKITDMAKLLFDNGYTEAEDDYLTALSYVTYGYLYKKQFAAFGVNEFTPEEMAAFQTEADTTWEASIHSYIDYYNTSENPTEEEMAALRAQAEEYFASRGATRQAMLDQLIEQASYDRLDQALIEKYGLEATTEDVLKALDEEVAAEKEYFENNVGMYEMYKHYGYNLYYQPAGYRGVLQILLEVDSALLDEYTAAQAAAEEEGADPEACAARLAAAEKAIMDSKQAVLDEIYARLNNGEKFTDLIPDYNIDPGMQNADNLVTGYEVHRDSATYDVPFVDAAFDDNMNAIGDVSHPHIGRYGIYIVYYHRDVPEGMKEVTEEEIESIRENQTNSALNRKLNEELMPQWQSESEITYVEDVLFRLNISVGDDGTLSRIENEPATIDDETVLPNLKGPFSGNLVSVQFDGRTYSIHEDFKYAMDQYEEYFDKWLELMSTLDKSIPEDVIKYGELYAKLQEVSRAMEQADMENLTEDESLYCSYVLNKITNKILAVEVP